MDLKCEYCGKIFQRRRLRRFCSLNCRNRWIAKKRLGERVLIKCATCGKEFTVKPSKRNKAKFCSRSCASKLQQKNRVFKYKDRTGANNSNWKGGLPERICEFCGKRFTEKNRGKNSRYCSPECRNKTKTLLGIIILECERCGRKFRINRARKDKAKFCSETCAYANLSETRYGSGNPAWAGGVSFFPYPVSWNKKLKEKIKLRDLFRCQLCGKTEEEELDDLSRKLSIHHIDYNKDNCDESNLITLCHRCNSNANYERESWETYFKETFINV